MQETPMPEWSIKIIPVDPAKPAGSAQFVPQNAPVGKPLATWDGDLVTWNNTTDTAHWPWPTDANYNPLPVTPGTTAYMSDDIAARQGSRPTYSVNLPTSGSPPVPYIAHYYCKDHPNDPSERGTISIIPPPTS
jgi:hypothetical protein